MTHFFRLGFFFFRTNQNQNQNQNFARGIIRSRSHETQAKKKQCKESCGEIVVKSHNSGARKKKECKECGSGIVAKSHNSGERKISKHVKGKKRSKTNGAHTFYRIFFFIFYSNLLLIFSLLFFVFLGSEHNGNHIVTRGSRGLRNHENGSPFKFYVVMYENGSISNGSTNHSNDGNNSSGNSGSSGGITVSGKIAIYLTH